MTTGSPGPGASPSASGGEGGVKHVGWLPRLLNSGCEMLAGWVTIMGKRADKMGVQLPQRAKARVEVRELLSTAPDGLIWLVGRRAETGEGRPGDWHLQGAFMTEDLAVTMCRDATYFVAPLPINISLPHSRIEWLGLYFPLQTPANPDNV